MMTARYKLPPQFDRLIGERRWVAIRCEWNVEHTKITKTPFVADGNVNTYASINDAETWRSFREVEQFINLRAGWWVPAEIAAADLDNCRTPATRKYKKWA